MKTAIVTGSNGFVGNYLLKELCKHGIEVYAVIKDSQSDISSIQDNHNIHIVYCAMEDLARLPDKIPEPIDVFFHLAWAGSTGIDRADYDIQLKNVHWTLDAVNVANVIGCKRFIGAGTLAEYDVEAYSPLDGSTPNSVSCYGAAKIAAHYMSKAESNHLGIDHLWAYLSNSYGIGNYTSNFINFAVKTMLEGKPANFTSGEQLYDFVHVSDIAQGLYRIAEYGKRNFNYYIGSTKPAKLKEYIQVIRNAIDKDIKLNLGAIPFNGIEQSFSVYDCSKLVKETGYEPQIPFEQGIKKTIPWIKQTIQEGKL